MQDYARLAAQSHLGVSKNTVPVEQHLMAMPLPEAPPQLQPSSCTQLSQAGEETPLHVPAEPVQARLQPAIMAVLKLFMEQVTFLFYLNLLVHL